MRSVPLVFAIALLAVGWATGGGAAQILFTLFGEDVFKRGAAGIGIIWGCAGVGLLLGGAIADWLGKRLSYKGYKLAVFIDYICTEGRIFCSARCADSIWRWHSSDFSRQHRHKFRAELFLLAANGSESVSRPRIRHHGIAHVGNDDAVHDGRGHCFNALQSTNHWSRGWTAQFIDGDFLGLGQLERKIA